jgi:hypothetical protein
MVSTGRTLGCSISSIADNGLVTPRDTAIKRVFQFQADGKARLAHFCNQMIEGRPVIISAKLENRTKDAAELTATFKATALNIGGVRWPEIGSVMRT